MADCPENPLHFGNQAFLDEDYTKAAEVCGSMRSSRLIALPHILSLELYSARPCNQRVCKVVVLVLVYDANGWVDF